MTDRSRHAGERQWTAACERHERLAVAAVRPSDRPVVDRHVVELNCPAGLEREAAWSAARGRLLAYDLFPRSVVRARVCTPDGLVRAGATIVQRTRVGLLAVESSVRVEDAWERRDGIGRRAGFRCATLVGHPVRGVETFELREDGAGTLTVAIDAVSCPSSWLFRLGAPFARRFQLRATRAAVAHCAAWLGAEARGGAGAANSTEFQGG